MKEATGIVPVSRRGGGGHSGVVDFLFYFSQAFRIPPCGDGRTGGLNDQPLRTDTWRRELGSS